MSEIPGFPDTWQVEETIDGSLSVRVKQMPAFVGWALVMSAILTTVALSVALPSKTPEQIQTRSMMLGGVAIGESIVAYVGLVFALNRTRIVAGREGIEVTSGPLWWPIQRVIAQDDIARVERVTYAFRGPTVHRLVAHRKGGETVTIVDRLKTQAAADALAAEIRRRVGLAA